MTEKEKYNICLIGSGGVGTLATVVLEKPGRANVTALLRFRYQNVKEKGWDIDSVDHGVLRGWRPSRVVGTVLDAATTDHGEPMIYDFVIVCTKQLPEIYSMASLVAPVMAHARTTIVLIQNGLDIELPLIAAFPTNSIMSAVSMIGSSTAGINRVIQIGEDVLMIGPHFYDCGGRSEEDQLQITKTFVDMYSAGLRYAPTNALCTLTEDMPYARWHKILWNGTFNTLCTMMCMNVGELQSSTGRETLLILMVWEVLRIARAAGHVLVESEIERLTYRLPDDCPYRPSMLLDLENERPMELEVILGNMLKRAKEFNVDAPIISTV